MNASAVNVTVARRPCFHLSKRKASFRRDCFVPKPWTCYTSRYTHRRQQARKVASLCRYRYIVARSILGQFPDPALNSCSSNAYSTPSINAISTTSRADTKRSDTRARCLSMVYEAGHGLDTINWIDGYMFCRDSWGGRYLAVLRTEVDSWRVGWWKGEWTGDCSVAFTVAASSIPELGRSLRSGIEV